MARTDAYARLVVEMESARHVLFLGPAGRTWREDVQTLSSLIADISAFGPVILHGERPPFDTYVSRFAELASLEVISSPPVLLGGVGRPVSRDPELFDLADLIIAFPTESPPPVSSSGRILRTSTDTQPKHAATLLDCGVGAALKRGVPVLSVYRYFPTEWEVP